MKQLTITGNNSKILSLSAENFVQDFASSFKISGFKTAPNPSLSIESSYLSDTILHSTKLKINRDLSISAECTQSNFEANESLPAHFNIKGNIGYEFTGRITPNDKETVNAESSRNPVLSKVVEGIHTTNLIWVAFLFTALGGKQLITLSNYIKKHHTEIPLPGYLPPPEFNPILF